MTAFQLGQCLDSKRFARDCAAQRPNSYLHTVNQLATNATPFTVRFDHEDYNFGHLFADAHRG